MIDFAQKPTRAQMWIAGQFGEIAHRRDNGMILAEDNIQFGFAVLTGEGLDDAIDFIHMLDPGALIGKTRIIDQIGSAHHISTWIPGLGRYATDLLRPTYGDYYGFEYSTPKNAELVAWFLYAYR